MNAPPEEDSKKENSKRLTFIGPRETKRVQRAREGRTARFMHKLRLWLPLLALIVISVLFLWPAFSPKFVLPNIAKNVPNLVIDNLHYTGLDSKNQAYSLSAAQATRPAGMHGIYDLTHPEGEITLQSGAWLDGKASFGRYDEVDKKLWLGGDVQLFHDKGYEVTTDEAQVNLDTDDAWGDKDVLIQGDFGTVRGRGFRFLDSGHTIVIEGPATAVLSLHQGTSNPPAPKEE